LPDRAFGARERLRRDILGVGPVSRQIQGKAEDVRPVAFEQAAEVERSHHSERIRGSGLAVTGVRRKSGTVGGRGAPLLQAPRTGVGRWRGAG